jgi:hypothetical protein
MYSVGVAPGTTTLQLKGSEEPRWMIYDRSRDEHPAAHPTGFRGPTYFDPYAFDIWRLRGISSNGIGSIRDDAKRMRWDLVFLVGGAAFAIAMTTSAIASGFRKYYEQKTGKALP